MAENKNKIVFYADWKDSFNHLTDEEAGKLIKHFFAYVNDEKPKLEDRLLIASWIPIEKTLKRDLKKWEQFVNKQSINGKKGGRPKTQKTQAFLEKPKKAVNDNVNVSVNDNVKVNNIEDRKADFKKSLFPFLEIYDKQLLKEFYEYWTEHGEKDRKFRKEKQKSFNTELRLKTWFKNQEKWEKEKSSAKKEKLTAAQALRQKYGISNI